MRKCFIYARQSSGSDDVSESVENQIEKCKQLAEKEGLTVEGIFQDLNTSGKTYPSGSEDIAKMDIAFQEWYNSQTSRKMFRDGLGQLLSALPGKTIDFILVYDVTRIYRPVTGSFLESHINQLLILHKVKLLTVNGGIIDVGNFNDSLITALQNRINHEQIAIQRQKSKEAINKLHDTGEMYNGLTRKWGFCSNGRKREVEINEAEAEMVRYCFETIAAGCGVYETLRRANEKFKSLLENRLLNRTTLKRMLTSPIYCGYVYSSQGELIKSKMTDGFIQFSLWKEVQEIFERRKQVALRPKKNWLPLTGYVRCGKCGSFLICHSSSRAIKYYTCETYLSNKAMKPCKIHMTISNHHSHTFKRGEGLVEAIYPLLVMPALKELETASNQADVMKKLEKMKVDYANALEREKKITEMYINGMIDENTMTSSLKTNSEKKQKLNMEILALEGMLTISGNGIAEQMALIENIVHEKITHEEYERLARKTLKRILITDAEIKIETMWGEFTLPRQKVSNSNLLPHYWLNLDKNFDVNIIYYKGVKQDWPRLAEDKTLLADFGKLKVWYME
jgi:hypothetical protein